METPIWEKPDRTRCGRLLCMILVLMLGFAAAASAATLRYGAEGNEVISLQERLTELGYYAGEIGGRFDSDTKEAVKLFQKAHGLSADGAAGSATQERLAREDCITYAEYSASQPLSKGDQGEEVVRLQTQLTEKGYYTGEIDGKFGSDLRDAVKQFQTANGMSASGKATTEMRILLNRGEGITLAEYEKIRPLKSGDKGEAVIIIQNQLTELGYYTGNIDGKYGSALKTAVATFQLANELDDSGKADAATRKLLNDGNGVDHAQYERVRPLKSGDRGEAVIIVQNQLTALGYYGDAADGKYDSAVKSAVEEFQFANGLDDSGKADVTTRKLLNGGNGVTAAEYFKVCPLKSGSKGAAVMVLQQQLTELEYYDGAIDGKYSTAVKNAVKAFQTANGIKASGTADEATRRLMVSGSCVTGRTYNLTCALKSGDSGIAVRGLQNRLTELGYYAGDIDGKYGSALKTAVATFQTANELDDSGKADEQTRIIMNGEAAVTAAEYEKIRPLKSGDRGEAVIIVQNQLSELGYYGDAADGKYDSAVKSAVAEFQLANGLDDSGKADVTTRKLLNGGNGVTAAEYFKVCPLKSGSKGAAVMVLQQQLTELEYYDGAIDGKYSTAVKNAVKAFQTANGIKASGTADEATRRLMVSGSCVTGRTYNLTCALKSGDSGIAVRVLQNRLTELGYYAGDIDGKYGSALKTAVATFQTANELDDSGKADEQTRIIMNSEAAVTMAQYDRVRPMKSGSSGNAVIIIQTQLTELGYYTDPIDGKYDAALKSAVKLFQTANGIKASGTADEATRALLNSGKGITAEEYELIKPLEYGDKGDAVTMLQTQLAQLGYYVDQIGGRYTSDVKDAVKTFQAANALKVTGKADTETRRLINSGNAVTRGQYDADRDLEKGEIGSTVYALQVRLMELGYAEDIADGRYEKETRTAVKLFQKAHTLAETGIADVKMRRLLFSDKAVSFEVYENTRAIEYGEEGNAVRSAQAVLKSLGYYTKAINGDYDSSMRDAVELYQMANGLEINDKLISAEMRAMLNEGAGIPLAVYYWSIPLESGDRGEAVKNLQTRLTELGYFTDSINGRYSSSTEEAVMIFQLANGLEVTGAADAKTREVMNSSTAVSKAQFDAAMNDEESSLRGEVIEKLIAVAESKMGCPYVHKTQGPDTFDCSGFTSYVYGEVGIYLSAASYNQGYLDQFGKPYKAKLTSYSQLKRGDLLVFDTNKEDSDLSDHLGIYLGNGKFIHCSSARGEVVVSDLLKYGNFSWAFRLI